MVFQSNLNLKRAKIFSILAGFGFLFCCLLFSPSYIFADDTYYVSGRVFQISPEDADDETIAAAELTGEEWPYLHISIHDQDSGALLGEKTAGGYGQFTVIITLPTGSPAPNIECRVFKVVDGHSQLLPPARTGINSFTSISGILSVHLKVVSDEIIAYGDLGFCNIPGIGLVFTRVGKVEIPYMYQDISTRELRKIAGLADFEKPVPSDVTDGTTRAGELGFKQPYFVKAPFASRLLIFGDFGEPGSGLSCYGNIDWYQVEIQKLVEEPLPNTGFTYEPLIPIILKDPLSKTKTEIQTFPTFNITNKTEKIGPYTGTEGSNEIEGLYRVNRNQANLLMPDGSIKNIFYSFPDLRINWLTSNYNGLYRITVKYYREVPGGTPTNPEVEEFPAACFVGTLPATLANKVALNELFLQINNQALNVTFNNIYLKNETTNNYFAGEGVPDVTGTSGAYDFNDEGLCNIMNLLSTYEVEIDFTAHHQGGYMRVYSLRATANDDDPTTTTDDSDTIVNFTSDSFTNHTSDVGYPLWEGTAPGGTTVTNQTAFTHDCGYIIDLRAWSRLQNGYYYVQWKHPRRTYYIRPN